MSSDRVQLIVAGMKRLVRSPRLVELRALRLPSARARSACFSLPGQVEDMARQAVAWEDEGAKGIYWTINPLRADMEHSRASARDADILCRHYVLIDLDPVRPADCCSTDDEKALARLRLRDLLDGLRADGFVRIVTADSGNGYHALVPIILPNDETSKVQVRAFLKGLDARLSDSLVKVDTSVFNAARIARLYGTLTRKGTDTAERPYRRSALLNEVV